MPSWTGPLTYPPPPRRSRSRSPRATRYMDPYADPYRPEWEYDRERAWAGYDRDRALYDQGRRGRSRSPHLDDSRKRRRSLSPYERDRYDPRPRYGDDYDAHSRSYGYGSPPRRGGSRRAPPDPHTLDYPASLKQYADWFRYYYPTQAAEEDAADKTAEMEAGDGSKPRNGIKSKWEKYKKDFANVQLQTMFDHHRKSPWFAEKYDPAPDFQALRSKVRKEGWKGRISKFLLDLESGAFDPDVNEPSEPEPSSPIKAESPVKEESEQGNGGMDEVKPQPDDDAAFTFDADDEPAEQDAARPDTNGKGPLEDVSKPRNLFGRGEEVSVDPESNTVMIRTIPPDIGRMKLEAACSNVPGYMYLALGDPLQKRNYYRAGWLRFTEDADMPTVMAELSEKKIEGFKLHVSHNTRPFVNRVRFTPEAASRPERLEKDLANAKMLASILEEEAAALRAPNPVIDLEKNDEQNGEDVDVHMAPPPEAGVQEDQDEPEGSGSEAVERRIEKILSDMTDQGLLDPNNEETFRLKKATIALDMYLAYLRAAFHTCYYCALVTDHLEELQRKCIKHTRRSIPQATVVEPVVSEVKAEDGSELVEGAKEAEDEKEADRKHSKEARDSKRSDDRWVEWLESKIALLIDRDNVDPREYGGKNYDEELAKSVEPHVKQEDEGKFRCKICQKLFKATSFVEKHIANKHPETIKSLEDLPYFNNFALDPHRIQPFAHPPAPIGNSQPPPPQAYGINAPPPFSDYGRPPLPPAHYGPPGGYPPYSYGGGYWDPYPAYPPAPAYGHPSYALPPRRDEPMSSRRLSERISGYPPDATPMAHVPGLPPKPSPAALDSALVAGNGSGAGPRRGTGGRNGGPPPPPPPDAKEDPRAAAGKRISYHDMDLVAEGDVELQY